MGFLKKNLGLGKEALIKKWLCNAVGGERNLAVPEKSILNSKCEITLLDNAVTNYPALINHIVFLTFGGMKLPSYIKFSTDSICIHYYLLEDMPIDTTNVEKIFDSESFPYLKKIYGSFYGDVGGDMFLIRISLIKSKSGEWKEIKRYTKISAIF